MAYAKIRYRYHGKFISEGKARRLANFKNSSKFITSEVSKVRSRATAKIKPGFHRPSEFKPAPKIPKPAPKPISLKPAPKPAAAPKPPPPPSPRRARKIAALADEFDAIYGDFQDYAGEYSSDPSPEGFQGLATLHERLSDIMDDIEDTGAAVPRDIAGRFDEAGFEFESLRDITPGMEYDFEEEMFGLDEIWHEDDLWEEFDVLDLDTDEEYPEK